MTTCIRTYLNFEIKCLQTLSLKIRKTALLVSQFVNDNEI